MVKCGSEWKQIQKRLNMVRDNKKRGHKAKKSNAEREEKQLKGGCRQTRQMKRQKAITREREHKVHGR